MTDPSLKLSAYLDGELDPAEMAAMEAFIERDPAARAELDALIAANAAAEAQFDLALGDPAPFALAREVKAVPLAPRRARPRPVWQAMAASLLVFALGGAGGYWLNAQGAAPAAPRGWLAAVAEYHAIYAGQERHLVEVGADEAAHIETWLGNTVGVAFSIPDLSGSGLTFQGGRLLVANGKPVAQLMYTQADGTVVALCFQRSAADGDKPFGGRTLDGFDAVSWTAGGADYVVIGPGGHPNLDAIATEAATQV